MESCRRRRHSPRCCCSTQKKHESGHAFTPQTPKKPRGQTHQNRDGPTWVLWSRSETLRPETPSRRRRSKEQSRRMFACPHQKKRTKITEIQVGPSSSKTTFDPRSDLQSLQPSPPSHLQKHTSKIQATGTNRMEHHNDNGLRLRRQLNETSGWFS